MITKGGRYARWPSRAALTVDGQRTYRLDLPVVAQSLPGGKRAYRVPYGNFTRRPPLPPQAERKKRA